MAVLNKRGAPSRRFPNDGRNYKAQNAAIRHVALALENQDLRARVEALERLMTRQ